MQIKKIIISGIQASGKGTQSLKLSQLLGIQHLSTGDLLRKYISIGSELVDGYSKDDMDAGKMAPISVIEKVMAHEISTADNFILDGFPRTMEQLKLMEKSLSGTEEIDLIIHLEVSPEVATHRMKLRGRDDDNEAGIQLRIDEFYRKTMPVISNCLAQYKNFYTVDGNGSEEYVFNEIKKIIDDL